MGFLAGLSLLAYISQSLNFHTVYLFIPYFTGFTLWTTNLSLLDFIFFLFLIGVIGKSSQIGLHP